MDENYFWCEKIGKKKLMHVLIYCQKHKSSQIQLSIDYHFLKKSEAILFR